MKPQAMPNWASHLVASLQALWLLDRPLELVLADDNHVVWRLDNGVAEGACNLRPDSITLYLRHHGENTEHWCHVLHECTHAAMSALIEALAYGPQANDNEVSTGIAAYRNSAYVQPMEDMTVRVARLLDDAVRTGATVRA